MGPEDYHSFMPNSYGNMTKLHDLSKQSLISSGHALFFYETNCILF